MISKESVLLIFPGIIQKVLIVSYSLMKLIINKMMFASISQNALAKNPQQYNLLMNNDDLSFFSNFTTYLMSR